MLMNRLEYIINEEDYPKFRIINHFIGHHINEIKLIDISKFKFDNALNYTDDIETYTNNSIFNINQLIIFGIEQNQQIINEKTYEDISENSKFKKYIDEYFSSIVNK